MGAKFAWFEIRPYATEEDNDYVNNIKRLIDHSNRFMIIIMFDINQKIRLFVGVKKQFISVLDNMVGIEPIATEMPKLNRFKRYAKYKMKKHHALPIASDDTTYSSMYQIMDSDMQESGFFAIHCNKTMQLYTINEYVRNLERGIDPEGMLGFIETFFDSNSNPRTPSYRRERIKQLVRSKTGQDKKIFICNMFTGTMSLNDTRVIESVFPASAFVRKGGIKRSNIMGKVKSMPALPMFFGKRALLISELELMSFLRFPEQADMITNLQTGNRPARSGGLRKDVGDDLDIPE